MNTADVYSQITNTIMAVTKGTRNPLTPHPRILTRDPASEVRKHNTFRVIPLQPSLQAQMGRCIEYNRQWQITVSFALNLAQDELMTFIPAMDVEDVLVAALSGLDFASQPPSGTYQPADQGKFLELILLLPTIYRRIGG